MELNVRSISRTSGMTREFTTTATSSLPGKVAELVHGTFEKSHPRGLRRFAAVPCARLSMSGAKSRATRRFKLLGEVGQQCAGATTEVGRGLLAWQTEFRPGLPTADSRPRARKGREKFVVTRLLAVPMLSLLLKRFFGQG